MLFIYTCQATRPIIPGEIFGKYRGRAEYPVESMNILWIAKKSFSK